MHNTGDIIKDGLSGKGKYGNQESEDLPSTYEYSYVTFLSLWERRGLRQSETFTAVDTQYMILHYILSK
jgi:hypothetical protein